MKEILVIRHGELANPRGIIYNRDSVMKKQDIIHLSDEGKNQLSNLARTMKDNEQTPSILWCSPETRAIESAQILQAELQILDLTIRPGLDDVYAPGPYREGMSMNEFIGKNVDCYDTERWSEYGHETIAQVTQRMITVVNELLTEIPNGGIAAFVSHGDPIAFLIQYLKDKRDIDRIDINTLDYPKKGTARSLIYDLEHQLKDIKNL